MLLQVMRRVNTLELLFILSIVLCSACSPAQSGNTQQAHTEIQQRVNTAHYSSFWIWGNISSSPYLQQATELYILQGEMNWNKPLKQSEFIPQGIQVLHKPQQKIWIVIRSHHLQWSNNNIQQILQRLKNWEKMAIRFKAYKLILMQRHKISIDMRYSLKRYERKCLKNIV